MSRVQAEVQQVHECESGGRNADTAAKCTWFKHRSRPDTVDRTRTRSLDRITKSSRTLLQTPAFKHPHTKVDSERETDWAKELGKHSRSHEELIGKQLLVSHCLLLWQRQSIPVHSWCWYLFWPLSLSLSLCMCPTTPHTPLPTLSLTNSKFCLCWDVIF